MIRKYGLCFCIIDPQKIEAISSTFLKNITIDGTKAKMLKRNGVTRIHIILLEHRFVLETSIGKFLIHFLFFIRQTFIASELFMQILN